MFDLSDILNSLNLSFDEFKEVCIVAGTDYNTTELDMYAAYKLWSEYKSEPKTCSFCDWLFFKEVLSTKEVIIQGREMYKIEQGTYSEDTDIDKDTDHEALKAILGKHNFINLQAL